MQHTSMRPRMTAQMRGWGITAFDTDFRFLFSGLVGFQTPDKRADAAAAAAAAAAAGIYSGGATIHYGGGTLEKTLYVTTRRACGIALTSLCCGWWAVARGC